MKKMSKKSIIVLVVVVLLLAGLLIYFRPLSLSDWLTEDSTIVVMQATTKIENGKPDIEQQANSNITDRQKKEILELFEEYTYRRKIDTVFSDGSLSSNGDRTYLTICIYDGTKPENMIVLADDGEIAVNDKNYKLKESKELIEKIQEILNKK